jgi:hypothetical protein
MMMMIKSKFLRALLILSAVISLGVLALVCSVNAYHVRHRGQHRQRLEQLLAIHPTESQLHEILGDPWRAGTTDEAVTLARQNWGGPTLIIDTKLAQRSPRTLVYLIGDMVYLLFLDSNGTMNDFVLLNN